MGWFQSKWFSKSEDKPKFNIGQIVYFPQEMLVTTFDTAKYVTKYTPHTIACLERRKSGIFFREFTYKLERLGDGLIVQNVYESEIFENEPTEDN